MFRFSSWILIELVLLVVLAAPRAALAQDTPRGSSGAAVRPPEPEPEAPAVVMPKLVHFERATLPADAQGALTLKLTVSATGAVTAVEVVEGLGPAIDEPIRAAALKFTFEPARQAGKAVAANILYQYVIAPPAPPEPPEPPPPELGNLSGTVRIADVDTPLVGAEIVVKSSTGETFKLISDGAGRWKLENLPPGTYSVSVTAAGFDPATAAEPVTAGEETDVLLRLLPEAPRGAYEVVVQGERPMREVTRRTIERREIRNMPGTRGDALRAIESLPGVARPPGLAGLIIVRGSAPEDTAVFIDGSDVPLAYHFGGITTVVPTELLDSFDFYPGNFSVKYGRQMGGIIDVKLRSPNTRCTEYGKNTGEDGCFHGLAQVDLLDARLLLEGPIGKDWSFIVAGRRSWVDAWIGPVLEEAEASVTSAPVYYDWQAVLEHKPSANSKLSLRFVGSDDRFEIIAKDPAAQDPAFGGRIDLGTSFYRLQAIFESELNSRVNLYSMASVGRTKFDFSLGTFGFSLDAVPIQWRSELDFKVAKGVSLVAGMDLIAFPFDVFVRFPQPPRPGEPDPGPFATRPPLESRDSGVGFRPGWYAEATLQPVHRLKVVPGVRVDYAQDSGHADISPRATVRYDIVSPTRQGESETDAVAAGTRRLRTTAKAGVGLFYQPPQFQETDEVFGTPGLGSNRAIHYALGAEQELTRYLELSLEGFYKDFDRLVSRNPDANGAFEYGTDGFGKSYGLEVWLKYKPDDFFFGWLAYTLSRSVRQDGPNEPERHFQFDQTHNLSVLGSFQLGKGWELGGRFQVVSGSMATPVLQPPALPALYDADAGAYAPLQGEPFSERLPLVHQLDVRVEKTWQFQAWKLSTYLDVLNIYNNPRKEDVIYNYNFTQKDYATGLPILPSIGLRGEF